MSLVLTSNFMQNLQTQQNNNHIIIQRCSSNTKTLKKSERKIVLLYYGVLILSSFYILKQSCVQACINISRYCLWAVDQVGPLPPFSFGVSNVQIAEGDFWGQEIIINYSVIIKTYIGMKKEDMERVKLFYDTTKGTQYLEKAVKYVIEVKDDESEMLTLYLTPVGCSSKRLVYSRLMLAKCGRTNDCFYVIDAGEFAQHHGKAIHSNMLCIFDPVTVDSC
ncbi:9028_t:CDS:2 [Entrophospora sp. SA101]|nr:9028_t:CDS:2 [Entrophospora sp. SA101]